MVKSKQESIESLFESLGLPVSIQNQYDMIVTALKRKQLQGSFSCSKATLEILRNILGNSKFANTQQMLESIRMIGKHLMSASPIEFVISNLTRRVLFIIREEFANLHGKGKMNTTDSNSMNMMNMNTSHVNELNDNDMVHYCKQLFTQLKIDDNIKVSDIYQLSIPELRQAVMANINELYDELDTISIPINEQAPEHIHNEECILTFGYSQVIESFFKAASKKRKYQLIIVENSPSLDGHKLALNLCKLANISITLIPDSNIYAIMSRVNKVIITPQAVLADGGAIVSNGLSLVAIAAKEFAVPVICLSGIFLLTPLFAHNQTEVLGHLLSPAQIVSYDTPMTLKNVRISLPAFDYLSPDLLALYVTNNGCHLPSYMYRLLPEYYHVDDYAI